MKSRKKGFSLRLLAVLLLLILSIAGCRAISSARQAQDPKSAPPGERLVSAAEIGLTPGSILTLDRALEIVSSYHPSIVQAQQKLTGAEAGFKQVYADYLPQVSASLSSRRGTSNTDSSNESNDASSSYSASATVNQLVFDWGKTPAYIRQARQELLAAQANLRTAENNIVYNVRQAYYDLIKQQALVKVKEETVRQFEKRLEQVKGFFEVGTRIKYDVTKSEVDLGNARLELVKAQNDRRISKAVLDNALGLVEEVEYKIKEPEQVKEFEYALDNLVTEAWKNHPELAAQKAREKAAVAGIDKAIAGFYPSLSLKGGYTWSGDDFPLVWNWSIGSVLSGNIFTSFKQTNELKEAVANLRQVRAVRTELQQRIYLDIKKAMFQMEDARKRLELTDLIVKQAEENLTLVEGRYAIGKASSVELTDAQVSLAKARGDRVQARFDYQTAIALIKKTIGEK